MGRPSARDLRRLAKNSAAAMESLNARGHSLAVCFDALVTVLDRRMGVPGQLPKVSEELRAELDRRMKEAEAKNAVSSSDVG
jgi:hypothetical protein